MRDSFSIIPTFRRSPRRLSPYRPFAPIAPWFSCSLRLTLGLQAVGLSIVPNQDSISPTSRDGLDTINTARSTSSSVNKSGWKAQLLAQSKGCSGSGIPIDIQSIARFNCRISTTIDVK